MLVNTELNHTNLTSAINLKVIPVASCSINVSKSSKGDLKKLDQVVKRELISRQMLGKQTNDKKFYLKEKMEEED